MPETIAAPFRAKLSSLIGCAAVVAGCTQMPTTEPATTTDPAGAAAHAEPESPALPPFIADAYRQRETDPEAVARGRALFQEYACNFCHGADIRGAAGGPSLLRSQLVQRDQQGELIGEVIRNGVQGTTMAAFALNADQIRDIAEFLHSFPLSSRDPARQRPETIVTGDAEAGRAYFAARCAGCHSTAGDLAGIASRITDPRELQQTWLMPDEAPPVSVTVATADRTTTGTLVRIDEFRVTIELGDGSSQTFRRSGNDPLVTLDDPLQAHRDLLPQYTDPDIHNVTAYLVTID
jgi:mono/diheme cytochrome c family protein